MKVNEIMYELFALAGEVEIKNTCDTCKAGDPEAEVKRVAVTMFPTPDVVRSAKEWGADLLIVHEPAYYNHMDNHSDDKIECEKRRLIEESGMTVFRFHDHPHITRPDIISEGELRRFGLKGRAEYSDGTHPLRFYLDEPITPLELARLIEERCGIKHIRICGARDALCTEISGMFGSPSGVFQELKSDECEIMLIGEVCEWSHCEYVRDAAQLGYKKAILILGHIGSERDGMVYTAEILKKMHPELEVKYFESEEVYTYTD